MSMVTAVKYLAEFAAEALRPWDPSRELASRLLADLPLMVRLREDDSATADEVTYLVLGRFLPAEPPAVPGLDFPELEWTNCHPDSDLPPCLHASDELPAAPSCADCGHSQDVHSRLNCLGDNHGCPCYAFRRDGAS